MKKKTRTQMFKGFNHQCDWRKATVMLAKCVVATLQTDGKIGMGTGMVMKVKDGKRIVERWDKDFIEALAFIGIEVGAKKSLKQGRGRREVRSRDPLIVEVPTVLSRIDAQLKVPLP